MPPRVKWDAKTKAMIVMAGLKGKPVSEICAEFQIRQNQYYKWRDQFLSNIDKVFESTNQREKTLIRQNNQLKRAIGELTIELKKRGTSKGETGTVPIRNRAECPHSGGDPEIKGGTSFLGLSENLGLSQVQ